MPRRIPLKELSADAFKCPADRAAVQNLERIPLLPMLVKQFNEVALDRVLAARTQSESIRCGPEQMRSVYGLLLEACRALDVPRPDLYVRYGSDCNALTTGVQRPAVILHSELIDQFTDEELLFVIGHELGHIRSEHILYQMLGRVLLPLLDMAGQATLGVGKLASYGLVSAFCEWLRQAEFTCDRAGLLACQDPRVAYGAIMKLGGGHSRYSHEMNIDAFLEQSRAQQLGGATDGVARTLLFLTYSWQLNHPQVVHRARELENWVVRGDYARILDGDYPRAEGQPGYVEETTGFRVSDRSGASPSASSGSRPSAPPPPPPQDRCPRCGVLVSPAIAFCRECGAGLGDEEPI